jgi:hypothetical protein
MIYNMNSGLVIADRDLENMLTAFVHDASDLVGQPLRPTSENLVGYIETVWPERSGAVWLTGWISRTAGQEFAAVIADRRKYAGAIAMACYEREDLPSNAHAFIALLHTDWTPNQDTTDVFLFIGPELKQFIRSVSPLRLQDGRGFAAEFARVHALCHAGRVNALRAALLGGQAWLPDTAAISGATMKAAADEVLALPGFGCFIQGWILSPAKRVVRVSLKLADRVLHSVPGGLYFLPRPDLASTMPHVPALLDRAGFVAVLAGPLQPEDLIGPVLKAWFSDGTSVNFPVDPLVVRRLGHAVPYEDVLRLFPGLADENFFAGCAAAISREMVARLKEVQSLSRLERSERYVVAALPPDASDARLMVDQIARHLRGRHPTPAVALLADHGAARAMLPLLTEVVHAATGAPCAAFLMEDTGKPLFALARLLEMLGARRFLYVAAGAFPEPAAWTICLNTLAGKAKRLTVVTAADGGILAGMAWTTASFQEWIEQDGCAIGSTHGQALLALAGMLAGSAHTLSVGGRADQLLEIVDAAQCNKGRNP